MIERPELVVTRAGERAPAHRRASRSTRQADGRRQPARRLAAAPARDRHARRARDLGRRASQRAAAPARPRAVPARASARPSATASACTGTPPAEIAAPIDVRGEFVSATRVGLAQGRRAASTCASTTRTSRPGPSGSRCRSTIADGRGAMRLWFEFAARRRCATSSPTSSSPTCARASSASCRWLELAHLGGRLAWHGDAATRRSTTRRTSRSSRATVSSIDADGFRRSRPRSPRTAATAAAARARDASSSRRSSRWPRSLPLPATLRDDLARHAPRGTLSNARYAWEGPVDEPASFRARGAIRSTLGVAAGRRGAGRHGLVGAGSTPRARRNASDRSQAATPCSRCRACSPTPLAFDSARGQRALEAQRRARPSVDVDELAFANRARRGHRAAARWTSRGQRARATSTSRRALTRADAQQPASLSAARARRGRCAAGWLRDHRGGPSDDVRLTLKGDLAVPVRRRQAGHVHRDDQGARTRRSTTRDGWPAIADDRCATSASKARGWRSTRGARRVLGAQLGPTRSTIADLVAQHAASSSSTARRAGRPASSCSSSRRARSPAGSATRSTGVQATGNGKLKLTFDLPLGEGGRAPKVAGEYAIRDNQLRLPGVPALSAVNGKLAFTERRRHARRDVAARRVRRPGEARRSRAATAACGSTARGTRERSPRLRSEFDATARRSLHRHRPTGTLALEARSRAARWTVESIAARRRDRPAARRSARPRPTASR